MALSRIGRIGLALVALLASLEAAAASEATKLGTFKDWTAWQSADENGKICYISSNPQDKQPNGLDHGDIYFFVINREKAPIYAADGKTVTGFRPGRGEVQAQMGYAVKKDGELGATIDGKTYPMFVDTTGASNKTMWLQSVADDPGFVQAMKAGRELVVKSTSARGNNTSYSFSLSGVTAAMAEIDKACPGS